MPYSGLWMTRAMVVRRTAWCVIFGCSRSYREYREWSGRIRRRIHTIIKQGPTLDGLHLEDILQDRIQFGCHGSRNVRG